MFDGVPEQLHQFIASSRTTLPLPSLSFSSSLHHHHHHHHHNHNHHGGSSNPNNNTIFPTFDPFTSSTTNSSSSPQVQVLPLQPSFLHPPFNHQQQQQSQQAHKTSEQEKQESDNSSSLVGIILRNNLESNPEACWSNDEVLALLRIRSSLDNWFPESTWEHVSRKLEELGYKRSAEKCKEKFEEEESRYFCNINYNKSHSFFNEFEEFYSNNNIHGQNNPDENSKKLEKPREEEEEPPVLLQDKNLLDDGLKKLDSKKEDQNLVMKPSNGDHHHHHHQKKKKKRKRVVQQQQRKIIKDDDGDDHHFETLKGFCEDIVKRMIMQQEEMHHKLLEDMVKRDEEKVAREEAWKKQEMDRVNKELEIMAHEQAIAGDRQATLIKFLKSFTTSLPSSASASSGSSTTSASADRHHHHQNQCCFDHQEIRSSTDQESPLKVLLINPNDGQVQNPSSNLDQYPKPSTSQNPNSPNIITQKKPLSPPTTTSVSTLLQQKAYHHQNNPTPSILSNNDRADDIGKRWPRDEVLALINLRCSLHNNGDHHHHQQQQEEDNHKEGQASKIPLWERISQGMSELGYKRSSKRCKEKWENINKYFRKTKDNVNKKRSLDSRTCPYFHQLSTLYSQGKLVPPPPSSSDEAAAGERHPTAALPENHPGSSSSTTDSTMHVVGHDHEQAARPACGELVHVQFCGVLG
ncbi:hypothetical protein ACOSQ3_014976 [Xanthoceras sorbifolium]